MCQHCENAPCEVVCPVAATVHSDEGLNDMVYNRCVGTRYCSNNCPYKVRRFNFLLYQDWDTPSAEAGAQPRRHGAQPRRHGEVHLLRAAHHARQDRRARSEDRPVRDGEIVTACQQVCPAEAIVFGDINDPDEPRRRSCAAEALNYSLLGELNTRPRTTYLAALKNPNPGARRQTTPAETTQRRESRSDMAQSTNAMPTIRARATAAQQTGVHRARATRSRRSPTRSARIVLTQKTSPGWLARPRHRRPSLALPPARCRSATCSPRASASGATTSRSAGRFDITNFVWWIGIGHAGTLISAILLLLRQQWRTSINRFAEAMTLFAVACAGMFPLIHIGRPWLAYWLMPIPNTMGMWPQFRSPLIWDVFAVSTYATVSLLFWYVGLIPDLATLRDRTTSKIGRVVYGIFALGWRGSAMHWHRYETAYLLLAGLATPLVVSVHTVVSFDFAVSRHARAGTRRSSRRTSSPGAIYSGFAMVLTLAIPIRAVYGLEDFITMKHLELMAKVMLATGLIVAYGYAMEAFIAWYSGNHYERFMLLEPHDRARTGGPTGA